MAAAARKSLASRAGAAARKVVSKKSAATKPPVKQAAPAKKPAPAKKTLAKKTLAKKTPAKTAASTVKSATRKTASKAAPAKKIVASKATSAKPVAKKAPAKKAVVKKAVTEKTAPRLAKKATATPAAPAQLVVLEQEDPWTKAELKEVRTQLTDDVKRLTGELAEVEGDLAGMIENSGEGAGHDQADVGSASFERDQEMVIVNNARDMLEQSQHALERIADGTYGQCEICGNPIGKNRLMAFPRATLCLSCKQREERR
ncbi:MAG: DNA-binding protein [Marmoricola sp.]|jgi:RNA polymerase-binding protein DksA|nr:DNA-binding protein [Marmoricola sp.]